MTSLQTARLVRAALAFLVVTIIAGCATGNSGNFKFVLTEPAGPTPTVQLIDQHTGQPISDAEVYEVRWVTTGMKNVPLREQRTPLKSDGRGGFVIDGSAGTQHLAACVPGLAELIRGELELTH